MSEDNQDQLKIEETAGGRDSPEYFEIFAGHYQEVFEFLRAMKINPKKIFIGACGLGADMLAAHRVWPEARITAVSVLDTPKPEVIEELGDKLDFQERTMMDFLKQADRDFSLRGFGLVVIFNTVSKELRNRHFNHYLDKIVGPKGFIFHCLGAGVILDFERMNASYDQISLPQRWQDWDYWLWQSSF